MPKNLVIVESPHKSSTIEKYLGTNYKVLSSKGHIRDLATTGKFGFGVDIEDNFKPNYIPIKGRKKDIMVLQKEVEKADKIFLATDPDREGEAISWHLKDELNLDDNKYERIVFNEITKDKVLDSFNHARKIDDNLVHSQETRRILDRIIGFRLSKLMQSKVGSKSAGRVQSVALKLIVDKEREIEAFKEEEYWTLTAHFNEFDAKLEKFNGKEIKINNEEEVNIILSKLSNAFKIEDIIKKEKSKNAKMPYITSTLQQDASNKLSFTSKKTMMVAQKLYEGINIGNETSGLITYMRTDSTRLSNEFINETFKFIETQYGTEYIGSIKKEKEKKNIQDAHEAIRPTSINNTPEKIKKYLSNDEYKLYKMIYIRSLASLMKSAKVLATTITLDNNGYLFKATGSIVIFDGYLKVYSEYESSEDVILPELKNYKANVVIATSIEPKQHFTEPPSRYSEAKLIKELEELGIGRPSTYSPTIDRLTSRDYVIIKEKRFYPTNMGIEVTDRLQEHFSDLINVKYTRLMEEDLDKVAFGKVIWYKLLDEFYAKFSIDIEKAFDLMEKKEPIKTGEICPNCKSDMVVKRSKYGEFQACSNYPECKYIKQEKKAVNQICNCPLCDGVIIEKKTKKGKIFYGCNNYPKCSAAYWYKPIGEICPKCGTMLVEKNKKIKCAICDYIRE